MSQVKYIYQLPYIELKNLCKILDADDSWEVLAGKYLKLSVTDILLLRKKDEPTFSLVQTFMGPSTRTVNELFVILRNMGQYQAMSTIKHLVDEKYHYLYEDQICNASKLLSSSVFRPYDLSSLPKPTIPGSEIKMPSSSYTEGACGGYPNNKSSTYENSNNMNISSKYPKAKCYDDKAFPHNASGNKDSNSEFRKEKNDEYFNTSKWIPQKKMPNEPLISLDYNNIDIRSEGATKQPPPTEVKEVNKGKSGETFNNSTLPSKDSRVRKSSKEIENALHSTFNIDYKDILCATNHFDQSQLLGRGGFGQVFRGKWKNTEVAIKRLKQKNSPESGSVSDVSINQSLIELKSLISYRHDNILPLYGISIGGQEPCLVYQYMIQGSLEDRLLCRNKSEPLMWQQRAHILKGSARGIQFLHTSGEVPLIHGDIKSANILLDGNLEPKIGDFGLAREGPQGHYTHVEVSSLHGTQYYLPQEYLRNRNLSTKVDTYSFGIVLFEVATGLRAFDDKRSTCKLLLEYVHEMYDRLNEIRDVKAGENHCDWFREIIDLGIQCSSKVKKNRPEMVEVLQKLEQTWAEEELKESGRKISRDGQDLPRDCEINPIAMQAYYDEKKKISLGTNQTMSDRRHLGSPQSFLPNSMQSSNDHFVSNEKFTPVGPPSFYMLPGDVSDASCDGSSFTSNNSPPPNYADLKSVSNDLPLLTCLGIKDDQEERVSILSSTRDSDTANKTLPSELLDYNYSDNSNA